MTRRSSTETKAIASEVAPFVSVKRNVIDGRGSVASGSDESHAGVT